MHGTLPAESQGSIFPADSSDIEDVFSGDRSDTSAEAHWFLRLAKKLWPLKPGVALHFLTKADERKCYRYAGGYQEPGGRFIVAILRSQDGGRFLDRVMHGSDAEWNKDRLRDQQQAKAARELAEQLKLF